VDYLRIWADEDGASHLEEVTLERRVHPAEPGVAEIWQSDALGVSALHVVTVKASDQRPDWHCGPRRQFVVFLDGWTRITTSDGDERRLAPGSVVLVEDLHGRGHVTEHEPGDRRVLVIPTG
jgi:quercetin dioxygenase-like cupin family protein